MEMTEDQTEVGKLREKSESDLARYRGYVKQYNENAQRLFSTQWTESKVVFLPEGEARAKEAESGYIVLQPGVPKGTSPVVQPFRVRSSTYQKDFNVALAGDQPADRDFLIARHKILVMYNIRRDFDRSQLRDALSERKLLISYDQLDMPREQVAVAYPFPLAVVERSVIDKYGATKGLMYLQPEMHDGSSQMLIVDAATGIILARATATKGKVKANTLKDLSNDRKQLDEIKPLTVY
jgi:hypothetical protein